MQVRRCFLGTSVSGALAALAAAEAEAGGLVCAGGPGEGQAVVSVESPGPAPRGSWWAAIAGPAAPRYPYTVLGVCGDYVSMPEPCPVEMVFDTAGYRGVALAPSAEAAAAAAERNCDAAMKKDYGGLRHAFAVTPRCELRQVIRCDPGENGD